MTGSEAQGKIRISKHSVAVRMMYKSTTQEKSNSNNLVIAIGTK
jgi:hypothetical protein